MLDFPRNYLTLVLAQIDRAIIRLAKPNVGKKTGFMDRGVLELDVGTINMDIKLTSERLDVDWSNSKLQAR